MGHCRLPSRLNGFNSQRASREATAGLARVACAGRDALEASQTGSQHLRPKLANYRRARSAARQANQCAGSITTEIAQRADLGQPTALWLKGEQRRFLLQHPHPKQYHPHGEGALFPQSGLRGNHTDSHAAG